MTIHYSSTKLERILESERLIKRYYSNYYDSITNRLTELRAAKSLNDIPPVPPPRRHKLSGEYVNCWGIDYSRNYRFIIEPFGSYDARDLTTIEEINIIELTDYH